MINHKYTVLSTDCRSKISIIKDDNAPFFEVDIYEEDAHAGSIEINIESAEELIKYLQLALSQHNG